MAERTDNGQYDQPYQELPLDHARPLLHVQRSDGSAESGWIPTGTSVVRGVEYTRVIPLRNKEEVFKYVPTTDLYKFDAEIREQKRREQMGRVAGAASGAFEQRDHPAIEPYVEPEDEQTLSAEALKKLRSEMAAADEKPDQ